MGVKVNTINVIEIHGSTIVNLFSYKDNLLGNSFAECTFLNLISKHADILEEDILDILDNSVFEFEIHNVRGIIVIRDSNS